MIYHFLKAVLLAMLIFFNRVPTANDKTLTRYRSDGRIL